MTRDSPGVDPNTDLIDITCDDASCGLDGDSDPQVPIDHLLLGKGESSRLADNNVGPLGADASTEIG